MSFRHKTKLEKIAKMYSCDNTGCDSNGDLIDRLCDSPVNIGLHFTETVLKALKPVQGHRYMGQYDLHSLGEGFMLEFQGIASKKVLGANGNRLYLAPVGGNYTLRDINCRIIVNDVEDSEGGNLMFIGWNPSNNTPLLLSSQNVETLKSLVNDSSSFNSQIRFTFKEVINEF